MSDSFVTQCPHCQTSFRVSHAQLSMARGVVRCGSCLQVFNAAQQLLNKGTETEQLPTTVAPLVAEPVAVEPPAAPKAISPAHWEVAELDLEHLDLDEELAKLEEREIQPSKSFGQSQKAKTSALSARRDTSDADESQWSGSLFSESAAERAETSALAVKAVEDDIEPAETGRTEPSLSLDIDEPDDTPPLRLSKDDDDEPKLRGEHLSAVDDDEGDEPLAPASVTKDKRTRSEPGVRDDVLLDLVDDPLHLDWQKRRSPWGKRLLWTLLVLLAAVALAGQYIAYHFDELARQDQYRPLFQQLCPQIGCSVPSKVDIDRIKSSNLVVRSHPEFAGALVVDAILYNRAPFSQPYPLLELRFADLNGKMIASRRFKPGEYLSGDLTGKAEMPPQTPIHIALDILDPGPKAVNYSLSFHSPE
ncbi:DUF3426 domain-containing protein [Pseudomonas helleri]|uniref:DUF3426 domain-containing protein n=1 Tax=Pseudomonas helleri TaxID=1608996 RepID=A0A6A7YNW3_9PSED|nr:DUF3426 domain-containing protein [Pseudomonas helleri]MQT32624.1 DUF3426 domain-containing protein [Pseudomonas helleri]MQT49216.1 DUF3426 domain-containing protein [Pseudomonas helleri]MQT90970.1 DUF3426 domain-containing protein [Pseudomonas helleri]